MINFNKDEYFIELDNIYLSPSTFEIFTKNEYDHSRFQKLSNKIRSVSSILIKDDLLHDKIIYLNENVIYLRYMSGNIGHFYNDHLYSVLSCFYNQEFFNIKCSKIIISSTRTTTNHYFFLKNSLLKEDQDKIEILSNDTLYFIKKIYIPIQDRTLSYRTDNFKTYSEHVREHLWSSLDLDKNYQNKQKNAIIYFDGSHGRSIINSDELKLCLEKLNYNVEILRSDFFNNKSSLEIWMKYFTCDLYIAPWGAHFTQCLICRPQTKMIILRTPKCKHSWYFIDEWCNEISNKWCIEYIHNNELNNCLTVLDCEYVPWEKSPGTIEECSKKGYPWSISWQATEYSADLIVNTKHIEEIIKCNKKEI